MIICDLFHFRGTLNRPPQLWAALGWENTLTPEEEDKVVEALEELRINYNLRQWRVCSLICESLADKFRTIANKERNLESATPDLKSTR